MTEKTSSQVSLHDCVATDLIVERGTMSFFFPEGIWIDRKRAAPARVIYAVTGDPVIYIFEEDSGYTVREQITAKKLSGKLGKGKWKLEFGYRYDNAYEAVITGWIWKKKPRRAVELMMFLPLSDTYYQTK